MLTAAAVAAATSMGSNAPHVPPHFSPAPPAPGPSWPGHLPSLSAWLLQSVQLFMVAISSWACMIIAPVPSRSRAAARTVADLSFPSLSIRF